LKYDNNAYRFSKEYVCFTFFIEREHYNDLKYARKGDIAVFGKIGDKTVKVTTSYGDKFGKNAEGEAIILVRTDDAVSDK
jgi:hypothetical protein